MFILAIYHVNLHAVFETIKESKFYGPEVLNVHVNENNFKIYFF